MVLWSNKGRGCEVALRKCGQQRKIRRSLERGRCRRGFKPDAAAGSTRKPERDHIRLRGVGFQQYRKSAEVSQAALKPGLLTAGPGQNGLTITRTTIPIISTVGTSLIRR